MYPLDCLYLSVLGSPSSTQKLSVDTFPLKLMHPLTIVRILG